MILWALISHLYIKGLITFFKRTKPCLFIRNFITLVLYFSKRTFSPLSLSYISNMKDNTIINLPQNFLQHKTWHYKQSGSINKSEWLIKKNDMTCLLPHIKTFKGQVKIMTDKLENTSSSMATQPQFIAVIWYPSPSTDGTNYF